MTTPVCPHCGKVTDGEVQDKEIYLVVICEECSTILGVLPKYFQKCTWKHTPKSGDLEEEEAPTEVSPGGKDRQRGENNKNKKWD
ncbi:MAG: hypothetical protein KAS77_03015 [Thermoplasmata archaeon]|nr:hypothetical protein [Thermoplasmata archaeon]